MRTLSSALTAAQKRLNRRANSRVIARDVFLRLSELTSGAVATNFPDATLSDIPQCPYDFLVDTNGQAWRAWMKSAHLYVHPVTGTLSAGASWEAGSATDITLTETHRPSLADDKLFYGDSAAEKIYYRALQAAGALGAQQDYADVPSLEDEFALAAVASGCYIAELVESGGETDFKHVEICKVKGAGAGFGSKDPEEYAGAGTSVGGAGAAWSNPSNVGANDNSYADADLPSWRKQTEVLQARTFGFDIPARATVLGVTVNVGKYATWSGESKYRTATVTWNVSDSYTRYPVCITMDTASEVSGGDMQADCSDLIVVIDGEQVDRWIADPNDATTNIWFNISPSDGWEKTVYIYYGGDSAQTPDDTYKPVFNLSTSSNTSWVYTDFNDNEDSRAGGWQSTLDISKAYNADTDDYTDDHGGDASPYAEAGLDGSLSTGNASSYAKARWVLNNPCGITNMNVTSAEYRLNAKNIGNEANQEADTATDAGAEWVNESHWLTSTATAAQRQIYGDLTTSYVGAKEFGFSIPADVTVCGIKVEIVHRRSDNQENTMTISDIKLLNGAGATTMPGSSISMTVDKTTSTKGDESELWNTTFTPAQINSDDFGVEACCTVSGYTAYTIAELYRVRVTVYYTKDGKIGEFGIESSVDGSSWTEEWDQTAYAEEAGDSGSGELTNDNSWNAWSQNEALTANSEYAALYLEVDPDYSYGSITDFQTEMSGCTLTLDSNNTPTVGALGAEVSTNVPVRDLTVQLVKSGDTGDNKADGGTNWPEDAEDETSYGGAADMWGLTLTPAEVNSNDFGVNIAADVQLEDAHAYIDYVEIEVTYQPNTDESPHAIVVDSEYTEASLSWFDAVTLGDKDVLVINRRAYGDPVYMFYEDGAWSDPQPILPADVVDNYTFLRISGMSVITDSDGDDVIWACGRIGRGGSTGLNAQEWDCVLRTKDGEHWTLDRFSYLCENAKRGRLQVSGDYAYYPSGSSIMYGTRTWLLGNDPASLKWTIEDDLLNWRYSMPGVSQPCTGTTQVADHDAAYKPYKSGGARYGIWAGYWLWRYAGYDNEEVLLSTEGIDKTPGPYRAGDRQLRLESRDIVTKSLVDWASDQDWQWLSQAKNYDDCDEIDRLYSVSGTQIEVTSGDLKALVDQTEMIEADDASEIYYDTVNNEGVFLCTKPGECRNFVVSATFRYTTNTNGRNLSLSTYLGFGFGVVGCVHGTDAQYNLVAAYYDTKTDKLYILRRTGDSDSDTWSELASSSALAGSAAESQRNRIELHRDGPNFTARILRFTQGSDVSELASVEYEWAETDWICDQDDDRGRVGVLCNMDVTSAVGTECIYITDVQAYDGDDTDKSLEWTLKDIAAKAGIMDFETAHSVDEEPFDGDDTPSAAVWLQDTDGDDLYQRDFDLTFTLPNQIEDGDSLVVIAKASSKLGSAPTDGNLTSFSGCKITYERSGTEWNVQFHQTTADSGSSTKADWVKIDEVTFDLSVDDTAGGKRARIVGYDDFFAVYINNRWIRTFHLGPIFDDPDDGYDSTMEDEPGYIGVYRGGSGADWEAMTVTQPELWTWTDGIIVDQKMNAISGMQRVIKERRVYLLPRADGTLKLSQFEGRDSLDSLRDQIYEDADSPTDRIPTHIRAVGEEISDYIDHSAAADWGLTFALVQCPSLAEQESYDEAVKIVEDAVSNAEGKQLSTASRVDWEPEDSIAVKYSPVDGGPDVDDSYVVSSVSFSYRQADLSSMAFLREDRS